MEQVEVASLISLKLQWSRLKLQLQWSRLKPLILSP
ncbi:hypothetical protein F383_14503 [Gossypium arboreum]|uniref:Uncharacterized protein n=1 Tax=Gossypium arboreum TaxID=29729 RepID=A0A0B0NG18_GOSAR|nr:hypothetical protein F383_14503 [Gossypium arboreum]